MIRSRTLRRSLLIAFLLFAAPSTSLAQDDDSMKQWESFDFSRQALTREQLQDVSGDDLRYMRGLVFGRHGRIFKDEDIQAYLAERPWYKPDPNYSDARLSKIERQNVAAILAYEKKASSAAAAVEG